MTPNLRELLPDYRVYDIHIHSTFSDGNATPDQIAYWAKMHEIGISITDHNEIRGCLRALEADVCEVVPGIEVASQQGLDVLAYFEKGEELERFYTECLEGHKGINPSSFTDYDVYDLMKLCRDYGASVVLPHPFWYGRKNWTDELADREKSIIKLVDGIECCNSSLPKYLNRRALELAERLNKTYLGGSDSHDISTLASVVTLVPRDFEGSFLQALHQRLTSVIGYKTPFIRSIYGLTFMAAYHMSYWPKIIRHRLKGTWHE